MAKSDWKTDLKTLSSKGIVVEANILQFDKIVADLEKWRILLLNSREGSRDYFKYQNIYNKQLLKVADARKKAQEEIQKAKSAAGSDNTVSRALTSVSKGLQSTEKQANKIIKKTQSFLYSQKGQELAQKFTRLGPMPRGLVGDAMSMFKGPGGATGGPLLLGYAVYKLIETSSNLFLEQNKAFDELRNLQHLTSKGMDMQIYTTTALGMKLGASVKDLGEIGATIRKSGFTGYSTDLIEDSYQLSKIWGISGAQSSEFVVKRMYMLGESARQNRYEIGQLAKVQGKLGVSGQEVTEVMEDFGNILNLAYSEGSDKGLLFQKQLLNIVGTYKKMGISSSGVLASIKDALLPSTDTMSKMAIVAGLAGKQLTTLLKDRTGEELNKATLEAVDNIVSNMRSAGDFSLMTAKRMVEGLGIEDKITDEMISKSFSLQEQGTTLLNEYDNLKLTAEDMKNTNEDYLKTSFENRMTELGAAWTRLTNVFKDSLYTLNRELFGPAFLKLGELLNKAANVLGKWLETKSKSDGGFDPWQKGSPFRYTSALGWVRIMVDAYYDHNRAEPGPKFKKNLAKIEANAKKIEEASKKTERQVKDTAKTLNLTPAMVDKKQKEAVENSKKKYEELKEQTKKDNENFVKAFKIEPEKLGTLGVFIESFSKEALNSLTQSLITAGLYNNLPPEKVIELITGSPYKPTYPQSQNNTQTSNTKAVPQKKQSISGMPKKDDEYEKSKNIVLSASSTGNLGMMFKPMATGGIVTQPTFTLLGEKGAEAVIPLESEGIPQQISNKIINSFVLKNMQNLINDATNSFSIQKIMSITNIDNYIDHRIENKNPSIVEKIENTKNIQLLLLEQLNIQKKIYDVLSKPNFTQKESKEEVQSTVRHLRQMKKNNCNTLAKINGPTKFLRS